MLRKVLWAFFASVVDHISALREIWSWWASKMSCHSALHPFYLKSQNQSVPCRVFFCLTMTMRAALCWEEQTSAGVDVSWVILQQSWCCGRSFPAVKCCPRSLVHETTIFTINTWAVLPMRCFSQPACQIRKVANENFCIVFLLNAYFRHLIVLMN